MVGETLYREKPGDSGEERAPSMSVTIVVASGSGNGGLAGIVSVFAYEAVSVEESKVARYVCIPDVCAT